MSTYKYSLFDYHAISQAEITIDGITVLAGDNGCGKRTLSRWLYYLVNTSTRYDNEEIHIKQHLRDIWQLTKALNYILDAEQKVYVEVIEDEYRYLK